jgi:hypothetical protein
MTGCFTACYYLLVSLFASLTGIFFPFSMAITNASLTSPPFLNARFALNAAA